MLDAWRSRSGEALATLVSNLVGPVIAILVAVVLRSVCTGAPRRRDRQIWRRSVRA
jgi:hypothetical protein